MFKNILVEATASLFGVRNSEANIKRSRVLKSTRRKLTALAKAAQESRRLHATLREQRRERMESARIKLVEAMLGQANRRPDHCRMLLKKAKHVLPGSHMIALVPGERGLERRLVKA